MSQRCVVHIFPGQGDFSIKALTHAAKEHTCVRKAVRSVFECVDRVAQDFGISPLGPDLLDGTPPTSEDLASRVAGSHQLALFGAQMSIHYALKDAGLAPDRILGVSFGELAALTASGVFTIESGAHAAIRAARSLLHYPGGMTLLSTNSDYAEYIVRRSGSTSIAVACINHANEVVVTGPDTRELDCVEQCAADNDVRAIRLKVPFLCHHQALEAEANDLVSALERVPTNRACIPIYSAVHARAYVAGDDLHRRPVDSLVLPFHLPTALNAVAPEDPALWIEIGTGGSMARMAQHTLHRPHTIHSPIAEADFPWNSVEKLLGEQ